MALMVRVLGLIFVLLGTLVTPTAQSRPDAAAVKQKLIGSYRLVSYLQYDEKGVERKANFTIGQISYDAANRMSAHLMAPNRPTVGRGQTPTDAQRAAAAAGYVGYFGRYEIDAERGVVTHHVDGSSTQNMVGTAMPRWYEFSPDGNTLYLMTKNGDRITGRLQWVRHQ
jgi:hypothetical protein